MWVMRREIQLDGGPSLAHSGHVVFDLQTVVLATLQSVVAHSA
jgi:hypothetical protein